MERKEIQDIVANNVRNILNQKHMSAAELAKRSEIAPSYINKILNAKTGVTVIMAVALAKGLNVDIAEILRGLTHKLNIEESEAKRDKPHDQLSIGIISINNKRITCIKNQAGTVIGTSELTGGLDLVESSSNLLQLIQEAITEAAPNEIHASILKQTHLKLVTQSYEFVETRYKFIQFMKKHFKNVLLISDWQLTYLNAFKDANGISLVLDKGVSLSYMNKTGLLSKIGGWKFPVYDLGGENWLGCETIRHTIEATERYIPMSKLAQTVLSHFNGKIERITEACFRSKDADIYCLFSAYLLQAYYTGDEAAKVIVKKGYDLINRTIQVADKTIGSELKIALNGSLTELYQPFFNQKRLLLNVPSDLEKVKLLADLTEESLLERGVRN